MKAGGDQPFWSLVLDGQQASLTTPNGVESYQLDEVSHPAEQPLQLAYGMPAVKSDDQSATRLLPGRCQPALAGYAVTLQLDDGQTLSGCGE